MADIIHVPGVPCPRAGCHAIRTDRLTWTGAICGSNAEPGDASQPIEEMAQALVNLAAVLRAAGHEWRDLVRVNVYYAAGSLEQEALVECQHLLASTIGARGCAGSSVMLAPAAVPARLAVEAIAASPGAKQVLGIGADADTGPWAAAVRIDSTLFISGVVPDDMLLSRAPPGATPGAIESPFFQRSHSAYRRLARIADMAGNAWPDCNGMADVVRLHQHVTPGDIDLGDFRRSRASVLRTGDFVSTTVRAAPGDPDRSGRDPWIKIDAELVVGPRRRISVPGVWANPGGLHAVVSDRLAFFQAQMGRDGSGANVGVNDPERHADQLYANIDRMLAGAGLEWRNVVHVRIFCRDESQVELAVRRLLARTGGEACAVTCVVAGFFDPGALLEVEITAAH